MTESYWSKVKRSRWANLLALLFIATFFKVIANMLGSNGINWDYPHWSLKAAKESGLLVSSVKPNPVSFVWNGETISFRDVWIEREVHTAHPLIWLSRYEPSGDNYLCFTLSHGEQLFSQYNPPLFASAGIQFGGYLGTMNGGSKIMFFAELRPGVFESHKTDLSVVKKPADPRHSSCVLGW